MADDPRQRHRQSAGLIPRIAVEDHSVRVENRREGFVAERGTPSGNHDRAQVTDGQASFNPFFVDADQLLSLHQQPRAMREHVHNVVTHGVSNAG